MSNFIKKEASQDYINSEIKEFLQISKLSSKKMKKKFASYKDMRAFLMMPVNEETYNEWIHAAFEGTFATWNETGSLFINNITTEKREELLLEMLKKRPISFAHECVKFTFGCTGVSRAVTHQLVRHRKMCFGQQSLRVSDPSEDSIRVPQKVLNNLGGLNSDKWLLMMNKFEQSTNSSKELYRKMVENGVPREQARLVLPIGITTKIYVTMDLGAMIDYFKARTSPIAQAEHTYLAICMASSLKYLQPKFYNYVSSKIELLDEYVNEFEEYNGL